MEPSGLAFGKPKDWLSEIRVDCANPIMSLDSCFFDRTGKLV